MRRPLLACLRGPLAASLAAAWTAAGCTSSVDGGLGGASSSASSSSSAGGSAGSTSSSVGAGGGPSDPHNCGATGHDCLGGDCQDSLCQPIVLATSDHELLDHAVNSTHVYFTEPDGGKGEAPHRGHVYRVPINGGPRETLQTTYCGQIGLAADRVIYAGPSSLMSMPLAGGPAVALAPGYNTFLVHGATIYGFRGGTPTRIESLPVGGGAITTLVSDAGESTNWMVANDSLLVWPQRHSIESVPLTGGASKAIYAGPNLINTGPAVDTSYAYFVTWDGSHGDGLQLVRAPLTGDAVEPLMALGQPENLRMMVDDSGVAFGFTDPAPAPTGDYKHFIQRIPKAGGAVETVTHAPGALFGTRLLSDASAYYYIVELKGPTPSTAIPSVVKLAK